MPIKIQYLKEYTEDLRIESEITIYNLDIEYIRLIIETLIQQDRDFKITQIEEKERVIEK